MLAVLKRFLAVFLYYAKQCSSMTILSDKRDMVNLLFHSQTTWSFLLEYPVEERTCFSIVTRWTFYSNVFFFLHVVLWIFCLSVWRINELRNTMHIFFYKRSSLHIRAFPYFVYIKAISHDRFSFWNAGNAVRQFRTSSCLMIFDINLRIDSNEIFIEELIW